MHEFTIRAVCDQKRELLRDWMDRRNVSNGIHFSIDDFLEKSNDYVDFEFSFIGLDVHFYFFLDIGKGAITIDSTFFEEFDHATGSWGTVVPEALVSFMNVGAYNYLGNKVIESDIIEKTVAVESEDLVIHVPATPSMDLRPVTGWLKTRDGELTVVIKEPVLDELRRRLSWFDPVEFGSIVLATHWRNYRY